MSRELAANGGPKQEHVKAAGFGGGDWDGTERRRQVHPYHGGGGDGGTYGKKELAIGATVGALAALFVLLAAWFSLMEYSQRPLRDDLDDLSKRVDSAITQANAWRLETSAQMSANFASVRTDMRELISEDLVTERLERLNDVDRVQGAAIADLNKRMGSVELLLQRLSDRMERLDGQQPRDR